MPDLRVGREYLTGIPTERVGREYLRVSSDRSGRQRSPDEQHDDNERVVTALGITLGEAYREATAVSASRYSKKIRDDFARLVSDLKRGRFGAQVLILWESSRGSRKVGEWVTLIDLCEAAKVTVFVTSHGREYDPANPRDRRSLLEDAVDSEWESSKTRHRVVRTMAANAAAGRPHGVAPFGYRRDYDSRTRQLIAQVPYEPEAAIVRELFERLKKGHSLASISRDFTARGIRNRKGTPYVASHLRDMAMRASYAGIRTHDTSGADHGHGRRLEGSTQGTWEPLVDRALFFAVRERLTRPERLKGRSGGARHLLTGLARCEVCGGPLMPKRRLEARVLMYECHEGGHVYINMADLDQFVEQVILACLSDPAAYEVMVSENRGGDGDLAAVRGELAQARAELADARESVAAGILSVASLVAIEPRLMMRIGRLETRERELMTPATLRGLIEPGVEARRAWAAMPLSARRDVARYLMVPGLLGEIRVGRRPVGRRTVWVPARERVALGRDAPAAGVCGG